MSLRQELAAILMEHSGEMPEQTYMNILNKLGQIPDHRDPIGAEDLQKQLDTCREELKESEEEIEALREQIEEAGEHIEQTNDLIVSILKKDARSEMIPNWTCMLRALAHTQQLSRERDTFYNTQLSDVIQRTIVGSEGSESSEMPSEEEIYHSLFLSMPIHIEFRVERGPSSHRANVSNTLDARMSFRDVEDENNLGLTADELYIVRKVSRQMVLSHFLKEVVSEFGGRTDNQSAKCLLHEWEVWHTPLTQKTRSEKRLDRFPQQEYRNYIRNLLSNQSKRHRTSMPRVGCLR